MKRKNLSIVLNIIAIAGFILLATAVAIRYSHFLVNIVSNPQKFKSWVLSFGHLGVLVFILTQILQVIISAIPGEAVQISGGYLYGTLLGTVYSLIGIMIGSVCVFYITRLLGFGLVRKIVSEEKLRKFYSLINSPKGEIAIFLLFLIPGLPKDILTYIAGLSPIKPLRFFAIVAIARLPGIFFSSYIGSSLEEKNYTMAIVVSAAAAILFVLGVVYRDKIIKTIHNCVHKKGSSNL
ncbi:SNARE associated Golgi protein-related protein [Caldicellulosiruptor kronotskyensis 2002]|uniref:TVP38/TMEM64 family membrane protein n=1 Tax=Caldicellulosiruptor kronotskyensis (strain DSM 18902 / VKM B-2412 / 2002) TaxID=632348 RepID=E4SFV5_CALK2|nr:TVP38/TMEM64 family protein [Caldicellulosiruptor kronotskyensis]ADQ46630.1 SNARE associated Golgi protein-related protein [Caldicellulosiruptor kronotskyensis 2002]